MLSFGVAIHQDVQAAEQALAWRFILYADGIGRGEKAERRA
jgi:hypothetical protein